jgi:hypothetical protein
MAAQAVSLAGVMSTGAESAQQVHSEGHWFQVARVYASGIPAQVVEGEISGD